MARPEIEGDWVMGWPDRKRAGISAGKDAQGRIINGRSPVTQLEGLLTPTDAYYIVNQLEVPEPMHPDDWVLQIGGLVSIKLHDNDTPINGLRLVQRDGYWLVMK